MENNKNQDRNHVYKQGRVKKLLERFEESETVINAAYLPAKSKMRYQPLSQQSTSKQTPVDIYQRRNILRKKSRSHTDIRPNEKSTIPSGRFDVMLKSCSYNEHLSEQIDHLTVIRSNAWRRSIMQSGSADSVVPITIPAAPTSAADNFVQSMYAGSSESYVMEKGNCPNIAQRHRPKPPLPIKPAKLKDICSSKDAQKFALPVVPPKLPNAPAITETSEYSPAQADIMIETLTYPKETKNCTEKVLQTVKSDITNGTVKPSEISTLAPFTGIISSCFPEAKDKSYNSGFSQSSSNINSTINAATTIKRTSFINGDIKKPKTKPPPPPIHSFSPTSCYQFSGTENNKHYNIKQKLHTDDDNDVNDRSRKSLTKLHRFERKCAENEQIPSIPSICPPQPPTFSPLESNNDGMYEEIEGLNYKEENRKAMEHQPVDEWVDEVLTLDANLNESGQNEFYDDRETSELNDSKEGDNLHSINAQFITTLKGIGYEQHRIKNRKENISVNRKVAAVKRPKSALEFDKLLRIKSDIRLNITRKVGQIKLKVSSASQVKQRHKSVVYVDHGSSKKHDIDKVLAKIEFPLDEQCIYGDDWSSDEAEIITAEQNFTQTEKMRSEADDEKEKRPNDSCSMLSEIERELCLRFKTNNKSLPVTVLDVVLESKRRSVSADPLLQDIVSNIHEAAPTLRNENKQNENWKGDGSYELGGQIKGVQLRPTAEGYETVVSTTSSSPEHNCLPSTSSGYALKKMNRTNYTPRIIPDPQPLYQIYMMEQNKWLGHKEEEACEAILPSFNENTDKSSKVQRTSSIASTDSGRGADCSTTKSQLTSNMSMRRDRLVASSHFGSQRSLWCELSEVKNSGLLETLDEETKKLQEAYFEVITSEASYLRSLNILITHFMAAPELLGSKGPLSVITDEERKQLFSNIFAVRDCSERLLSDLENRLQSSLVLPDVCDILCDHFETNFDAYVKYCSNQVYQDRTLRKLKFANPSFLSCIQRLENDRICQGLDMRSFLMLPMQRITRYPLLVIAILERTEKDTTNYQTAQIALHLVNHIVTCCNEGARRMERTEQLLEIERRLVYKSSDLKRIPLVSSGRYLVKHGSLICLNGKRSKKLIQTRQYQTVYIFLFNDIIMLTKKKINGAYVCKDYSARRFVDIEPIEINDPKLLQSVVSQIPLKKPHLFICTLMHNARGKQVELLLNADSETDRERWLSALRPPACSNPEEKIYADWDCPQAVAVHHYSPSQEDELSLEKGDLVNILRKMPDGWFYGERVRDGYGGWFPSSYVQQVLNDHVRANNYRQRLRVIQAAADFRFCQQQAKTGNEKMLATRLF